MFFIYLIRAATNKQRGRMRAAGRQFDMPALSLLYGVRTPWESMDPRLGTYALEISNVATEAI